MVSSTMKVRQVFDDMSRAVVGSKTASRVGGDVGTVVGTIVGQPVIAAAASRVGGDVASQVIETVPSYV